MGLPSLLQTVWVVCRDQQLIEVEIHTAVREDDLGNGRREVNRQYREDDRVCFEHDLSLGKVHHRRCVDSVPTHGKSVDGERCAGKI